jgi:cardiolipin synthase (CMP-forming)
MGKNTKMKIWSIPNFLTSLRLVLVPVFNYYFLQGNYGRALFFLVVAGFSDFFDGILARLLKARTTLGAILDPVADKILMAVTFVVLAKTRALPIWMAFLVLGKDFYVVCGLLYLKMHGRFSKVRPTSLSKFNTGCQLGLITFCFSYFYLTGQGFWGGRLEAWLYFLLQATLYFTACMTILTGIQYTILGLRLQRGETEDGIISGTKNQTGGE